MPIRLPFRSSIKKLRRPPLARVNRYSIDYGAPDASGYEQLSDCDLAIIEPQLHEAAGIRNLRTRGTIVAAYFSVMEAPRWNRRRFDQLQPSDYLRIDGETRYLPEWDAYLIDLRQPGCRRLLLAEAGEALADKGCSGLMLDTVDDIDALADHPELQQTLAAAYSDFVAELKSRFPTSILIQNRGFFSLPLVSRHIDGLLWEDWNGHWKHNRWLKNKVALVSRLARKHGISVFTVTASDDPLHRKEAEKLGFVHLTRSRQYHLRE